MRGVTHNGAVHRAKSLLVAISLGVMLAVAAAPAYATTTAKAAAVSHPGGRTHGVDPGANAPAHHRGFGLYFGHKVG